MAKDRVYYSAETQQELNAIIKHCNWGNIGHPAAIARIIHEYAQVAGVLPKEFSLLGAMQPQPLQPQPAQPPIQQESVESESEPTSEPTSEPPKRKRGFVRPSFHNDEDEDEDE